MEQTKREWEHEADTIFWDGLDLESDSRYVAYAYAADSTGTHEVPFGVGATADAAITDAESAMDETGWGEACEDEESDSDWSYIVRPLQSCECPACGCDQVATRTDDADVPVCDDCVEYSTDEESGEVYCSRTILGDGRCPACESPIQWGSIVVGQTGTGRPTHRAGTCGCDGAGWIEEDRGGWQPARRVVREGTETEGGE